MFQFLKNDNFDVDTIENYEVHYKKESDASSQNKVVMNPI